MKTFDSRPTIDELVKMKENTIIILDEYIEDENHESECKAEVLGNDSKNEMLVISIMGELENGDDGLRDVPYEQVKKIINKHTILAELKERKRYKKFIRFAKQNNSMLRVFNYLYK